MEIDGDNEVTFGVEGGSLAAIEQLANGADAYAYGDFGGGLSVNTKSVEVSGDSAIKVYGNDDATAVTKISGLSGEVDVVKADGVNSIGADGDGTFTFTFAGQGESFAIDGNSSEETWFTFGTESVVTGISGIDSGETVTGNFSNSVAINDTAATVKVTNDSSVGVARNGDVYTIYNLSDGAKVETATGISSAWTDTVGSDDSAAFTFGDSQNFTVKNDSSSGVEFLLDNGTVTAVDNLDSGATLTGSLSSLNARTAESASLSTSAAT